MLYKDTADFPSISNLTQSAYAEFFFGHRKKLMMSLCRECEIVKSKYIALESSESSGLSRTVAQCGERSNYIRRRAKQVDDKRERFSDSRRASGSQKLTEEDAAGCTVPSEI